MILYHKSNLVYTVVFPQFLIFQQNNSAQTSVLILFTSRYHYFVEKLKIVEKQLYKVNCSYGKVSHTLKTELFLISINYRIDIKSLEIVSGNLWKRNFRAPKHRTKRFVFCLLGLNFNPLATIFLLKRAFFNLTFLITGILIIWVHYFQYN